MKTYVISVYAENDYDDSVVHYCNVKWDVEYDVEVYEIYEQIRAAHEFIDNSDKGLTMANVFSRVTEVKPTWRWSWVETDLSYDFSNNCIYNGEN